MSTTLKLILLVLGLLNRYILATYGHPAGPTDRPSSEGVIDLSIYGDALYGSPDHSVTGARLSNLPPDSKIHPEELGTYLEGDILIPFGSHGAGHHRDAVTTLASRWPKGVVPYEINGDFSVAENKTIYEAFERFHLHTCIRFVRHTNERDYITIENDKSGCWSSVGRIGGRQEVNLQAPSCLGEIGTVLHELMHVLGFMHEHNRKDRNEHVRINFNNIDPNHWHNFIINENGESFNTTYDYNSLMHYSSKAFSKHGQPTIESVVPYIPDWALGNREYFTHNDYLRIIRMYCKPNWRSTTPSD